MGFATASHEQWPEYRWRHHLAPPPPYPPRGRPGRRHHQLVCWHVPKLAPLKMAALLHAPMLAPVHKSASSYRVLILLPELVQETLREMATSGPRLLAEMMRDMVTLVLMAALAKDLLPAAVERVQASRQGRHRPRRAASREHPDASV